MKSKLIIWTFVIIIFASMFCACSKKKNNAMAELSEIEHIIVNTPALSPTPEPTIEPEPIDEHPGMVRSILTGEWILEEDVLIRPFAVMFNNINVASPQSGIGDADILYEALVEAGITRLMGVYGKLDPDSPASVRLGSIRSARHYFASIASEYDAIYVHFGGTTYADKKIKKLSIDSISGTSGYGVDSFYRDKSIKAPHNAFANLAGINKGIERGKMRTQLKEDYTTHFSFYDEEMVFDEGTDVGKIVIPFSSSMQPYFLYNEDEMNYTRYQFDKVHIDYNTSVDLKYKNIIIQFVEQRDIDKNGYQTMDFEDAEGSGYYITNGKMVSITWKKNENKYFMKYYDKEGNELMINTGKTYIAVFPSKRSEKITIE